MGRAKLTIKKLECKRNLSATYFKRKIGILHKAKELSILCDIPIVLLMFSPSGRPTLLQQGERSNLEDIITTFAQHGPQERAESILETLEILKKSFKNFDHGVKIQDFLGSSTQRVEELNHQVGVLQNQLAEVNQRLSNYNNIEKIDSLELLSKMEVSLRESINQVCLQKDQLIPLQCSNQLQEGMNLPMMMANLQSWLLDDNDNHNEFMLPNDPQFLAFSDNTNSDAECSTHSSLPGYSGDNIGNSNLEVGSSTQVTTLGHGGCDFNVQQFQQFPYLPPYF